MSGKELHRQSTAMIKALEQAVEKVKKLSRERQEYAAEVLEQIAEAGDEIYALSDEERRRRSPCASGRALDDVASELKSEGTLA